MPWGASCSSTTTARRAIHPSPSSGLPASSLPFSFIYNTNSLAHAHVPVDLAALIMWIWKKRSRVRAIFFLYARKHSSLQAPAVRFCSPPNPYPACSLFYSRDPARLLPLLPQSSPTSRPADTSTCAGASPTARGGRTVGIRTNSPRWQVCVPCCKSFTRPTVFFLPPARAWKSYQRNVHVTTQQAKAISPPPPRLSTV